MPRHFVRQYRAGLAFERLKDDIGRHVVEQAPTKGQFVPFVTVDRQQISIDIKIRHTLLVVLSLAAIGATPDATGFVLIIRDYVHLGLAYSIKGKKDRRGVRQLDLNNSIRILYLV